MISKRIYARVLKKTHTSWKSGLSYARIKKPYKMYCMWLFWELNAKKIRR